MAYSSFMRNSHEYCYTAVNEQEKVIKMKLKKMFFSALIVVVGCFSTALASSIGSFPQTLSVTNKSTSPLYVALVPVPGVSTGMPSTSMTVDPGHSKSVSFTCWLVAGNGCPFVKIKPVWTNGEHNTDAIGLVLNQVEGPSGAALYFYPLGQGSTIYDDQFAATISPTSIPLPVEKYFTKFSVTVGNAPS